MYTRLGTGAQGIEPDYYGNSSHPGAHVGGHSWADTEGHFWLFGGSAHVQGATDGRMYILY